MTEKSIFKKIFSSRTLSYLLILVLVFGLVSLGREINYRLSLKHNLTQLESNADNLEQENQKLLEKMQEVQTDYFKEKAARLQFGLQKPGEKVVAVVPADESAESQSKIQHFKEKISNLQKWWRIFAK